MNGDRLPQAKNYIKRHKKLSVWHKLVLSLAAIVVFVTTYMLILPAITMESGLVCTIEEHTHTEECYVATKVLTCGLDGDTVTSDEALTAQEENRHIHTDACYSTETALSCGMEEHKHTEECYTKNDKAEGEEDSAETASNDEVEPMPKDLSKYISNISVVAQEHPFADTASSGLMAFSMFEEANIYISDTTSTDKPVRFDTSTGSFKTAVSITFNPSKAEIEEATLINDGGTDFYRFYYTLPAEIIGVEQSTLDAWTEKNDDKGTMKEKFRYKITKKGDNYVMEIQFYKSFVDENDVIDKAEIHFDVELDKTAANGKGEIEIENDGELWLRVPVSDIDYPDNETTDYDITTKKTVGNFDKVTNQITYTVDVTSKKGTPADINLSDVLTVADKNLIESVECVGIQVETVKYAVTTSEYGQITTPTSLGTETYSSEYVSEYFDEDTGELSLSLNKLVTYGGTSDDEYTYYGYVITYTYEVTAAKDEDGNDKEISTSVTNKVTASSPVSDELEITSSSSTTKKISTELPATIAKSGQYLGTNDNSDSIKWTVEVNGSSANLKDAVLTDTMFARAISCDVSPSDGNYYYQYNEYEEFTGIVFKENNDTKYKITYYTPIGSWDYENYSNTATLTDGNGKVSTATANGGGSSGSITKSLESKGYTADGEIEVTWKVKVEVPAGGIPVGEGYDTLGNTGKGHYISVENAKDIIAVFTSDTSDTSYTETWKSKIGNVRFKAEDGTVYTSAQVSAEDFDTDIHFTQFYYDVIDAITQEDCADNEFTFSYKTTIDTSEVVSNEYYNNTISMSGRSSSSTYNYQKNVIKMDENEKTGTTSLTNEDGKLVWIVKVTLPDSCYALNVTDYLPEQVDLSSIEASVNNGSSSYMSFYPVENGNYQWCSLDSNNGFGFTTTVDENDVNVKVNVGSYNTSTLYLRYTCYLKSDYMPDAGEISETNELMNKVSVTVNNDQPYDVAEQTQNLTVDRSSEGEKKLIKSVDWKPNNLSYSLNINPNNEKYGTGDTYQVVDTLTYNNGIVTDWGTLNYLKRDINLNPASVKLYYAKCEDGVWTKGDAVDADLWSYESDGGVDTDTYYYDHEVIKKTITLTLPNNGDSFILDYTYVAEHISQTLTSGATDTGVGATNVAEITSVINGKSEEVKSEDSWSTSSAGGSISGRKRYTIYKYEKGKNNKYLQGAVYTLFKYENGTYVATDKVIPPTDEEGYTAVDYDELGLDANTLYCLVETTPPVGYELPEVPECLYFYCKDSTKESYLPNDLPEDCVDLSVSQPTRYMENAKVSTTSVTLNKIWRDIDGELDDNPAKTEVMVDLYARYIPIEEASPNTEYVTVTLRDNESYYGTTRINRQIQKGKTIRFVIKNNNENDGWVYTNNDYISGKLASGETVTSNPVVADSNIDIRFYSWITNNNYDNFDYSLLVDEEKAESIGTEKLGSYEIKADENWTKVIDNLPTVTVYNGQYVEVEYYVQEQSVDGYSSVVESDGDNQFKITNTKAEQRFIQLIKFWLNSDGSVLETPDVEEITCELRVKAYTGEDMQGDAKEDNLVKEVTLKAPWTGLIDVTNLPATGTDENGNTLYYSYYVVEESVSGFEETPTYTNNENINIWADADTDGIVATIGITNKKLDEDKVYVLPSTGGTGTTIYTIVGALFVLCATCCLYIKLKETKGES